MPVQQKLTPPEVLDFLAFIVGWVRMSFLILFFQEILKKTKTRSQLHFAFLLIQIWNVYIEQHYVVAPSIVASHSCGHMGDGDPAPSSSHKPITVIKEFWSKISPTLYGLLRHSQKVSSCLLNLFTV